MDLPSEAIDAYERALKIEPSNSLILYNLALVFAKLGRRDEACDALHEALRDPFRYEGHFERIQIAIDKHCNDETNS